MEKRNPNIICCHGAFCPVMLKITCLRYAEYVRLRYQPHEEFTIPPFDKNGDGQCHFHFDYI